MLTPKHHRKEPLKVGARMGSVDDPGPDAAIQGLALTKRKRTLLEARLLGQSNSLDGQNSKSLPGAFGAAITTVRSCSPGSAQRTSGTSLTDPTILEASNSGLHNTPSHGQVRNYFMYLLMIMSGH